MSLTLNFLGGAPFQLLCDGVRVAIGKTSKFKILLVNLETTLNCLQPRIIQQIRDRNAALNLPNEIIQDLQVKMDEGIELVAKLSRLSMWNIRVWGNCCNCIKPNYADQLDELDRSLRRLLEILKLEQMRNVTELLDVARRTFDKLDEVQRGQSEILRALQEIPGEILKTQQEIIERIEGYGVQHVANGGGGAAPARALGIAFRVLFNVVIHVKVKNVVFKRLLGEFKYTLDCLKPLIEEMEASDKLLHLPKQDVENYIIEMEKGVELVHKCCKALKWASYKKYKTTNKLLRLDESLQRLFIDLQGQVERNVKEAMDLTNNIEAVIKQIGGCGVEQNDDIERESWSPLQMLKPRSPTVGSDVLNMQGARDMIEETLIDVGVVGTEGTKLVVDSMHNVQGTMDVKETCDLTWSIEGIEVKRSEGSGVVQNKTEIAVVETEPPSATVWLDVLDVKGTRDVMETLDANVGVGVKHIEESVAPNQSEVAVAEPSSLTVGMDMQDLRRDVETMDFPRDMLSESDMGEGVKEVEGSGLVQYDQMEISSCQTLVSESDMGAGVKEVEGGGVVQNDQIEISACEVPKSPSPTVGFLEDEQKKTIQDIKKELEDPEQFLNDLLLPPAQSPAVHEEVSAAASSFLGSTLEYDVFLSFRGEDTRNGFTDHLYHAMIQKGIIAFRDTEKLERGHSISSDLLKEVIKESRIAVIILSANYATSTWCLEELAQIVECKESTGLKVLPVFYHVEPSEVRKQTGNFHKTFCKHEVTFKDSLEKVKKWREALKQVANLSGWTLKERGGESEVIWTITEEILKTLHSIYSSDNKDLMGMDAGIDTLMSYLDLGSTDVGTIGIAGMGGIGKSTLAKAVFEKIRIQFDYSCFIADVRCKPLGELQELLCQHLQLDSHASIQDVSMGIDSKRKGLRHKKVLIILDDVDHIKQLEAATVSHEPCLGPGSRVIITTRDTHILKKFGLPEGNIYEVEKLTDKEALQLLCQKTFKENLAPD